MITPKIEKTLNSPATSFWLKEALNKAMQRDPVDALHDAEELVFLLDERWKLICGSEK